MTRALVIPVLLLMPFESRAEDSGSFNYMKMLQPYQETAQDKEVVKQLEAIDAAITGQKPPEYQAALAKLQANTAAKKSLEAMLKSQNARTRALVVMGFRLLPVKKGFKEKLQYLLMDADPSVRRQVLLYVAQEPQGIELKQIQLALTDGAAPVRIAAVGAIVKTAKTPQAAADLFKQRLSQEQDPAVTRAIRIGFTALGLPTPDQGKKP